MTCSVTQGLRRILKNLKRQTEAVDGMLHESSDPVFDQKPRSGGEHSVNAYQTILPSAFQTLRLCQNHCVSLLDAA